MEELTERQALVLQFIGDCIEENGYPPTIREIGKHMGIRSTNGVNDHLKALERKGFLARQELKSRAIIPVALLQKKKLQQLAHNSIPVPIVGRVAAGTPLLAEQNIEGTLMLDNFFLPNNAGKRIFALRVAGESMIEDGIFDGDFIFVRNQQSAETGDIVVALIDNEATCKRYYPEGERIRFQPANAEMEPIYVARSDFKETSIIGVVVGVYRKMSS
jgi:repressor LexA